MVRIYTLLFFLCLSISGLAQEDFKGERSRIDVAYRFGFPNKRTRPVFDHAHTLGLRREFPIGRPFSFHASASHNFLSGANDDDNRHYTALGGGVTLYPISLATIIIGQQESYLSQHLFVDVTLEVVIHSGRHFARPSMIANLYSFKLKNAGSISPQIGIFTLMKDLDKALHAEAYANQSLTFGQIGVAYRF